MQEPRRAVKNEARHQLPIVLVTARELGKDACMCQSGPWSGCWPATQRAILLWCWPSRNTRSWQQHVCRTGSYASFPQQGSTLHSPRVGLDKLLQLLDHYTPSVAESPEHQWPAGSGPRKANLFGCGVAWRAGSWGARTHGTYLGGERAKSCSTLKIESAHPRRKNSVGAKR